MNQAMRKLAMLLILSLLTVSMLGAAADSPQNLDSFWTIDLQGKEVTQEIFSSHKLTLVNVWATFCPPCLQEMPALGELHREYANMGVQVIGIVTDVYHTNQKIFMDNLGLAYEIIRQTKADYAHLLPSQDLQDLRLKDVQVVPESFFVDSNGKIVGQTYLGAKSKSAWKSIIDSTLALLD